VNRLKTCRVLVFVYGAAWVLVALGGASCGSGSPPAAPTNLVIIAASRSAIDLTWVASVTPEVTAYRVERTPVGAAAFQTIAEVAGAATTSYSDAAIDVHVAYTYRVRAVAGGDPASEPSNQDSAGPPPAVPQLAVAKPMNQGAVYQYGVHTSLVEDENDDPAIAYVGQFSTLGSGDVGKLYFVRWNRRDYHWDAPAVVEDQLGELTFDHPNRQASLARDVSNGRYGLAYNVGYTQIWLAYSADGGLTWAKELVSDRPGGESSNPTLALAGDETHLAYWDWCSKADLSGLACGSEVDSHALVYRHRSGAAGTLGYLLSPSLPQCQDAKPWLDLALDANGAPGIAYFQRAISGLDAPYGYNVSLAFWRPGQAASLVTDSMNEQNDTSSVSLAFRGTQPVLAYHLARAVPPTANDLWLSQSSDGLSWGAPLPLPRDGTDVTNWYQSLAIDTAGTASIAAYFASGSGGGQFGGPKLLRSPDLATWTVSGPAPATLPSFAGAYVDTAYTENGKLDLAFFYDAGDPTFGDGVVYWREP